LIHPFSSTDTVKEKQKRNMDKSFGTLYHKLSNLFHPNTSPSSSSSSSTTSSVPETSSSLPLTAFFDRIVPSPNSSSTDQRRSSSRISRQISIKTNDNQITIPSEIPKQPK
jgi:hypothetical protein